MEKKQNEPIKVEQVTTPVTMGVTILVIACASVPLIVAFPKTFVCGVFVWLLSAIIKNNKSK